MQIYPTPESLVQTFDDELSRRGTLDKQRKDKILSRMSKSRLLQKRPVIRKFDEHERCYITDLVDDPSIRTQDPVIALPERAEKQEYIDLSDPLWQGDLVPKPMHA